MSAGKPELTSGGAISAYTPPLPIDPNLMKSWAIVGDSKKGYLFYNKKKNTFEKQTYGNWFTLALKVVFVSPFRYMFGYTSNRDVVLAGMNQLLTNSNSRNELKKLVLSNTKEGLELKALIEHVSKVALPNIIAESSKKERFSETTSATLLKNNLESLFEKNKLNMTFPKGKKFNSLRQRVKRNGQKSLSVTPATLQNLKKRLSRSKVKSLTLPKRDGMALAQDAPPPPPPAAPDAPPPPPAPTAPPPPSAPGSKITISAEDLKKKKEEEKAKKIAEKKAEIEALKAKLEAKNEEIKALSDKRKELQAKASLLEKEQSALKAKTKDKNYGDRTSLESHHKHNLQELDDLEQNLSKAKVALEKLQALLNAGEEKLVLEQKYTDKVELNREFIEAKAIPDIQARIHNIEKQIASLVKEIEADALTLKKYTTFSDGSSIDEFEENFKNVNAELEKFKKVRFNSEKQSEALEREKKLLVVSSRRAVNELARLEGQTEKAVEKEESEADIRGKALEEMKKRLEKKSSSNTFDLADLIASLSSDSIPTRIKKDSSN